MFPCYNCLWDSRDTTMNDIGVNVLSSLQGRRKKDIKWEPLVDNRNVLMSPLHIKLGLMKQFLVALEKEYAAFKRLHSIQHLFPKLSEAKFKTDVFFEYEIKICIKCKEFPKLLTAKENEVWINLVKVVKGYLGNHKAENYVEQFKTVQKVEQNGLQVFSQITYP